MVILSGFLSYATLNNLLIVLFLLTKFPFQSINFKYFSCLFRFHVINDIIPRFQGEDTTKRELCTLLDASFHQSAPYFLRKRTSFYINLSFSSRFGQIFLEVSAYARFRHHPHYFFSCSVWQQSLSSLY